MQNDVIGLNAAIWLHTTFGTFGPPDEAEGCVASEWAVCKLGVTEKGKTLKWEGKALERLLPLSAARPPCTGKRRLLRGSC